MQKFVIEDGILKAYFGKEKIVVVPDGVVQVGGLISKEDEERNLRGDYIGYKAFYRSSVPHEIYLPDSTKEISFKAMEYCAKLEVLSFSSNMTTIGCNALLGCNDLRKIIYRGTIAQFKQLNLIEDHLPNLEVVYCTDGQVLYKKA